MKYVQINAYSGGWADSIIFKKHRELQAEGHESWVFWARGNHEQDEHMQKIASYPEVCLDALRTRIDGRAGFHSKGVTRRLLKRLDEIDPDVVHLHILLGYYVNVEMLFNWLATHRCQVVWTLHDCWAFTGHCIYFTYAKCDQWKSGCGSGRECPQIATYPETLCRRSVRRNFEDKKRLFTMLPEKRVTLLTPSQWLADLVGQSFLSKYRVEVVHNTVNTDVFKPTPSDFRERYGIGDRFMVLGVASKWSERKGLDDLICLAHELDNRYVVVLVGLDRKQIEGLPDRIVGLPRTDTSEELAKAYTAADLFVTTSVEETYGMTVVEAIACGTPVVVCAGTACMEASEGSRRYVVDPNLGDLVTVVTRAREECSCGI